MRIYTTTISAVAATMVFGTLGAGFIVLSAPRIDLATARAEITRPDNFSCNPDALKRLENTSPFDLTDSERARLKRCTGNPQAFSLLGMDQQ